jgi:hypothetical protein
MQLNEQINFDSVDKQDGIYLLTELTVLHLRLSV